MNLVFLAHPKFLNSPSMERFSTMLAEEMAKRGHQVVVWAPEKKFANLSNQPSVSKWLGYIDQYLIFPRIFRNRITKLPADTLFVFTDHALGPWVPLVCNRPHVVHCHDFMAQRSGLGEIKGNFTKWSGRRYQAMIRRGYQAGKNFLPVSEKTRKELFRFVSGGQVTSEVVYNALADVFIQYSQQEARSLLAKSTNPMLESGYIMHIGGNQWYKNRIGVVDIYDAWRSSNFGKLPLLLLGKAPNRTLQERIGRSPYKSDILVLSNLSDSTVNLCYSGAEVFLFPSIDEGFGWPIAEAMACGCPVMTTGEAPMTEVGADAAVYIPRYPEKAEEVEGWALNAANDLKGVLNLPQEERKRMIEKGLKNIQRFNAKQQMDKIEQIYRNILDNSMK